MICDLLIWKCNFLSTILGVHLFSDEFFQNRNHSYHQYYLINGISNYPQECIHHLVSCSVVDLALFFQKSEHYTNCVIFEMEWIYFCEKKPGVVVVLQIINDLQLIQS